MNSSSNNNIMNNIMKMAFYFEEKTGKSPTVLRAHPLAYMKICDSMHQILIPNLGNQDKKMVLKYQGSYSFKGMDIVVDDKIDGIEME